MNKPTVTVTPDDGGGGNKMEVLFSSGASLRVAASKEDLTGGYTEILKRGLYHAIERIEELEAERDALRGERDELSRDWDSEHYHRLAVERDRDALAAHVETLSSRAQFVLEDYSNAIDTMQFEDEAAESMEMADDLRAVLGQAPQTSLSQRDSRIKARTLGDAARFCRQELLSGCQILVYLAREADKYHRQAEEN